jgi:hypothetical protein
VKTKKTVLILTDGSAETVSMAAEIAKSLEDNKVSVMNASEFKGNDILPADVFFLGCEKPKPDSFSYLADLLKHINLAGRPCGIFSPAGVNTTASKEAIDYLASLVHDSEAALNPEPLLSGSRTDTKSWAQGVISRAE